jgi:hypothetical protein
VVCIFFTPYFTAVYIVERLIMQSGYHLIFFVATAVYTAERFISQETFLIFKIVKSGAGYNCLLTVLKNQKGSSSRYDFTPNSRLT